MNPDDQPDQYPALAVPTVERQPVLLPAMGPAHTGEPPNLIPWSAVCGQPRWSLAADLPVRRGLGSMTRRRGLSLAVASMDMISAAFVRARPDAVRRRPAWRPQWSATRTTPLRFGTGAR